MQKKKILLLIKIQNQKGQKKKKLTKKRKIKIFLSLLMNQIKMKLLHNNNYAQIKIIIKKN